MSNNKLLEAILSPNRDYIPKASPNNIEDFMESTLYQDFLSEIMVRIEAMRDLNEECDSKMYLETRGGIKALRLISGIFTDLLNNANVEVDNINLKRGEGNV